MRLLLRIGSYCVLLVCSITDKCYLITHKNPKRKALHFKRPLRTSYASDSATAVTARWCPFSSCTHFPSVVSQILAVVSDDAVTRSDESAENAASHTHIWWPVNSIPSSKSAVTSQILAVLSEEVVTSLVTSGLKQHFNAYAGWWTSIIFSGHRSEPLSCQM